jgi:sugar lactone lactonase YvrE
VFLSGVGFGEGPRWRDGRLWFSDFPQHTVSSVGDDGVRVVELELDDSPSGLGWLPDGRLLVVAMESKRVLRVESDDTVVTHADLATIAPGQCNDMVVSEDGTAYVGNFGEGTQPTVLVSVQPDGAIDVVADELKFPNGSVITPDGRTLVVGETFGHRATAFTIAPDGTLRDRRVWADLGAMLPDGCTLDAEGAIWFADAGGTAVVRVREGGEITDRIETGASTIACVLGGDDGRTLFVTCTGDGGDAGTIRATRVDVPHAGLP